VSRRGPALTFKAHVALPKEDLISALKEQERPLREGGVGYVFTFNVTLDRKVVVLVSVIVAHFLYTFGDPAVDVATRIFQL